MVALCGSSALNYVEDIINAGYDPVMLEPFMPEDQRDEARKVFDAEYARLKCKRPPLYIAKEKYEDTLAMVREINPSLILAGADYVLELVTNLSYDLGLPCNNPQQLPYLREKDKMQEAAKKAGLRYIRGKVVSTAEEALDYYHNELKGKPAIVKPLRGAGSAGVVACMNEEELLTAILQDIELAKRNHAPNIAVLVQEMIFGTEYFVNTVTKDGHTVVTNVGRYDKRKIAVERPVYVSITSIDPQEPVCQTLCEYVTKVINEAGVKIGPAHTEVMVDNDGPVLIEINARLCGAEQPAEWQDRVLGFHESDISLRAYLGKDINHNSYDDYTAVQSPNADFSFYKRKSPGCIHFAVTTKDLEAEEFVGRELMNGLPSIHSWIGFRAPYHYPASIDLSTLLGYVFMVNDSEEALDSDYNTLLDIEMNHIERLFRIK